MELNKEQKMILNQAQETYGRQNQVMVTVEECCELAAVLSKYARYPDHNTAIEELYNKVLSEMADIIICTQHIEMIFEIDPADLKEMIDYKIQRLKGWLEKSKDMYQTTVDR